MVVYRSWAVFGFYGLGNDVIGASAIFLFYFVSLLIAHGSLYESQIYNGTEVLEYHHKVPRDS